MINPIGSFAVWAWASYAWAQGALGLPATIVINALAISLLHEMVRDFFPCICLVYVKIHQTAHCAATGRRLLILPQTQTPKLKQEHDLIHELYFKRAPWVQHLMFLGIWLIKSNAAPWWRKYYHLRHHQYSGQVNTLHLYTRLARPHSTPRASKSNLSFRSHPTTPQPGERRGRAPHRARPPLVVPQAPVGDAHARGHAPRGQRHRAVGFFRRLLFETRLDVYRARRGW